MANLIAGLNVALCLLGYAYVMSCAARWLTRHVFKAWGKRKSASQRQRALDALCDAFELDNLPAGTTRLVKRGELNILIGRAED